MLYTEHDIDLYCKGQLPQEQLTAFDEALRHDTELQNEVKLRMAIIQSLKSMKHEELRTTLREFQEEINKKRTIPIWRIAAIVVPLVVALSWYYSSTQSADEFAEYYAYYPNYEINITRGEQDTTSRAHAFIQYSRKDFSQAAEHFSQNLANDSLDYASQFYRGLTYLELQQFTNALADLDRIASSSSRYSTTATWYAALAAIKLKDDAIAVSYLKTLSKNENPYQKKSSRLLKKIKQP